MQSGAGAAAAGRGHHAPRCCHSRSVLTQTRDTDWWPGHHHKETESSGSGSIPALYWSSILHRLAIQYSNQYNQSVTYIYNCQILDATGWKEEGRYFLKLSWRLILILIVAFSFGEVVRYCKRLTANCISSHLNCSVPFIFLAPNTACHCRHKHLLRAASCQQTSVTLSYSDIYFRCTHQQ